MSLNATMRAVVWAGVPFMMNVTDLPMPVTQGPTDAIVRTTTSAICGTDLHVYHGVWGSSDVPYTMGHEAIGVVSEMGSGVTAFSVGDRVIIPDSVQDGRVGSESHIAFGLGTDFGLPLGLQAEYVRVPWPNGNLMAIP
ncbi:hypothetical protein NKR23_g1019 [Pleurostoma richardsiae]|uniref:Alcohol dehydrogenase-like N-terminal domain-containing protein n=1 Tax=Pleurostoma richardsiae TaxID=41990 RepID=A0AA38SBM8_9PEZI|nr:hypothetical protein NKR23_g1019 [Pleurostoma richardsiae]